MGRLFACLSVVLLLTLIGCGKATEDAVLEPLETEDVGAPVDASVNTDFDVQARSSEEIVGARLPDDFPPDVPLYSSSSIISYGPAAPDRHFVELSIPAQPNLVKRRYNAQIEAAGWRPGEDGEFVRQGRSIVVTYRQGTPGTWVRIEYPT